MNLEARTGKILSQYGGKIRNAWRVIQPFVYASVGLTLKHLHLPAIFGNLLYNSNLCPMVRLPEKAMLCKTRL
jgi:hypothetical protein